MSSFYKVRVSDIVRETNDCVSIGFEIPKDLLSTFSYQAGQYVVVKTNIDGNEIRRSYSLCSSPIEGIWRIAVKKIKNGVFSTYANTRLKVGDSIEIMPPTGNFIVKNADKDGHFVGFAAGSGITPIISIIKTVLGSSPFAKFTLFFGNRQTSSVIFKEELENLKNKYLDRFRIFHIFSREQHDNTLFDGRINAEKCERYANLLFNPQNIDSYFICGPEEMVFDVQKILLTLGVDTNNIHFELFEAPKQTTPQLSDFSTKSKREEKMCSVTIIVDGKESSFPLSSNGASILDAALKLGADLPFACKGGVCCTCKAKVLEGEVIMDVNYALEPDEVANHFVLTCQSHPVSDTVLIDYDSHF